MVWTFLCGSCSTYRHMVCAIQNDQHVKRYSRRFQKNRFQRKKLKRYSSKVMIFNVQVKFELYKQQQSQIQKSAHCCYFYAYLSSTPLTVVVSVLTTVNTKGDTTASCKQRHDNAPSPSCTSRLQVDNCRANESTKWAFAYNRKSCAICITSITLQSCVQDYGLSDYRLLIDPLAWRIEIRILVTSRVTLNRVSSKVIKVLLRRNSVIFLKTLRLLDWDSLKQQSQSYFGHINRLFVDDWLISIKQSVVSVIHLIVFDYQNNIIFLPLDMLQRISHIIIMFYFQYIIQQVQINYNELAPVFSLGFAEIQSTIQLQQLHQGINLLGIGKNLTVQVQEQQLKYWFEQYALVLKLEGSLIQQFPLSSVVSLQKLDIIQQLNKNRFSLINEENKFVKATIQISFKFNFIQNVNKPVTRKIQKRNQQKYQRPEVQKPVSFLYGKSKSRQKQVFTKTNQIHKQPKSKPHILKPKKNNFIEKKKEINDDPVQQEKYFMPQMIVITNQKLQDSINNKYQQSQNLDQMQNYSFQHNLVSQKHSFVQKSKLKQAYNKKQIRKMVQDQFKNKTNQIVIPILKDDKVVLKKLNQVPEDQLARYFKLQQSKPQPQQPKPIPYTPIKTDLTSNSKINQKSQIRISNNSISGQYPDDFQNLSIGHSQSFMSKSQSRLTNFKRQIVEQEQIMSEIYSEQFDSYNQSQLSRSNLKKSLSEISESMKSASQSYKK